jgi:hypothetical protein
MTFNPIIPVDAHKMLQTIISKYPLHLLEDDDIDSSRDVIIDFNHFIIPNYATMRNNITDIGTKCFPLAFNNNIVLVETTNGLPSVYRLQDVNIGGSIN